MAQVRFVALPHRALLTVSGEDRADFLQGLVSNDVTRASATSAIWSAFLTPQGRFLHEFFIAEKDGALLLEAEGARRVDLVRRLSLYRLRSKVTVAPLDGWTVHAVWGAEADWHAGLPALGRAAAAGTAAPFGAGLAFVDPRLAAAGFIPGTMGAWDAHRIRLGLPDGSRDLVPEKAILLENGFDELQGVDWKKGCYMGQELTARTKYRGLVRKRLMPVTIEGPTPDPGAAITLDAAEAGEMRSAADGVGLALIRLEQFEKAAAGDIPLQAGETRLRPARPAWAVFAAPQGEG